MTELHTDPEEPPGPKNEDPRIREDARGKEYSEGTEQGDSAPSGGKSKVINCLTDLEALRDYLRRVGAVPISLRRAAVFESDGQYKADVAGIRFDADGTVTVRNPAYAPTEKEAEDIRVAWAAAHWPKYILAPNLNVNPPKEWREQDDNLFVVRARTLLPGQEKRTELPVLMVHQRVPKDDGTKDYWCWTFYDDDCWRMMEPPEALPLFGMENLNGKSVAVLHEGAKAARECARLAATGHHPWPELALDDTVHLGWLGGSKAVGKTDWSPLGEAGIDRVMIVADNDDVGKETIGKISKALSCYEIAVQAVSFTDDFPGGFDLGDCLTAEQAPELFAKNKAGQWIYDGPELRELARPATWATAPDAMPKPTGRGRPPKQTYHLRNIFLREWWMVKTPKGMIYINRHDRTRLLTEQSFGAETRGRADCPVLDMFKAAAFPRTVDSVAYEPGRNIEINVAGKHQVNAWVPSRIRPASNPHPDSWKFWEQFLEHLFPVETERCEVMRWVATLIARPKVRMLYALLLASKTQGVGKTTLCSVIRVLVGEHNSGCPSANDVVNSTFNGWLVRKRFIYVNEIYESGNLKAYDTLKTYITDGEIEANEKMIPQYSVTNRTHYIFCSNSDAPLKVDSDDRRLYVPTVAELTKSDNWWGEFHSQLNAGGYAAIAAWAEHWARAHGAVATAARAPMTEKKAALIEDGQSRMERAVRALAGLALEYKHVGETAGLVGAVLVPTDVEDWLTFKFPKNMLPPQAMIRRWLVEGGMVEASKRLKVDGQMQRVCLPRAMASDSWIPLQGYREKPGKVFHAEEMM